MAKVVKVFRGADAAERALSQLNQKGFKGDEIAVVLRQIERNRSLAGRLDKPSTSTLGNISDLLSAGPLSIPLKEAKEELADLLTRELEIPGAQGKYYDFALQAGGVLIAIYTDETKASLAQQILKSAEVLPKEQSMDTKSPGFVRANRMVATDPVDAPMSGDFRRY
jgi:hypothetical protein